MRRWGARRDHPVRHRAQDERGRARRMGLVTDELTGLSPEEQWAAFEVARATGATSHAHDIGGRQGAVDVTLAYPDGRTGALEVTSHTEEGVQERDAILTRRLYEWPNPGVWGWSISVRPAAPIAELRRGYGRVIALCEQAGVTNPRYLSWKMRSTDPDVAWLTAHLDVTMRGMLPLPGSTRPGRVWVHAEATGGFVDERLVGLPAAVEELLDVPVIARHV